ncbi:CrcB family protein [Alcanivorax sp.]|jgi:CrcB protein|uniref:fluoride efflux transporter FluC n=1 Tax=Alcanivorax sp. TaxID=1872427 RepID=UPI0032D97E01
MSLSAITEGGMLPWIAVAIGGAVGACLRFATSLWLGVPSMPSWPWATFGVNLAGSFLFGLLAIMLASLPVGDVWRLALMTGMIGALTTFSTFSFELVRMVEAKAFALAAGYAMTSVTVCLLLGIAGLALGRLVFE